MSGLGQLNTASRDDRRAFERAQLRLPAQLYLPAEQAAQACIATDISAGGARITCDDEVPPLSAFVILHVEGFGRFECVTANFRDGMLGLRFLVPPHRRARLQVQIDAFLESGIEAAAWCGVER